MAIFSCQSKYLAKNIDIAIFIEISLIFIMVKNFTNFITNFQKYIKKC